MCNVVKIQLISWVFLTPLPLDGKQRFSKDKNSICNENLPKVVSGLKANLSTCHAISDVILAADADVSVVQYNITAY